MKTHRSKIEKLIAELCPNGVEWLHLRAIVNNITALAKLKKEDYREIETIPIIDQGAYFITGYTDENVKVLPADEYIIFGDHSEHIKYVDFSFIQGADGLKILKAKLDSARYIYHAFQNFYQKELSYKRHWSKAKNTLIPIPSLTIQKEIVRILDKFTTLTTELTTELTARKKQYSYYRDQLFTFEDGEVEWKTLGEVCEIADNKRKPVKSSLRTAGDIPYYGANNIQDYVEGFTHDGNYVLIAEDGSASLEKYSIQYATGKFWANNHVHVVRGMNNLDNRFLFHYLKNINFIPYLTGGTRAKLTKTKMVEIKIPIPPLTIQKEIVSILDKFDTLTHSISEGLPREIALRQKQYEYYRDLLLNFPQFPSLGGVAGEA